MLAAGIDLGATTMKSALVDDRQGVVYSFYQHTEAELGVDHVIQNLFDALDTLQREAQEPLSGVGIGVPGIISMDRKRVEHPPNLPGWTSVNLVDPLSERTGCRVVLENDANLAALGSARFGAGRRYEHFILLTLGSGVGGGIILHNELFRGAHGSAGELGHVIINFDGPESNSNTKGAVEAYIGQRFLSRRAYEEIQNEKDNPLYHRFSGAPHLLEPRTLYREAERGNALAARLLQEAGQKLGFAIVNYIHVLDIRTIILSGGIAKAGNWIVQPALETARERLLPSHTDGLELIQEPLGNEAALLGAGALVFESVKS